MIFKGDLLHERANTVFLYGAFVAFMSGFGYNIAEVA